LEEGAAAPAAPAWLIPAMADRVTRWFKAQMPSRDDLAQSRWIRPFGTRVLASDLWRFTRRSVPRGVGLGLLVGIFLLIPGLQIVGAALVSVPFRANIPIAAAMTFLSNPATTPFILAASLWVGGRIGFHADLETFQALIAQGAGVGDWLAWLFSDAAPALLTGLVLIALAAGALGFLIATLFWRWRTGRRWRRRPGRRGVGAAA
jgi:uncharacterized protein